MESEMMGTDDALLSRLLRRCGHFLLHRSNPGQQGMVLLMLRDGPMTQKQLQQKLTTKPGSVSELVSKLENRGWVQRSRHNEDRRKVVLTLTEEGLLQARLHEQRPVDTLFDCLTAEEKQQLQALMSRLLTDWNLMPEVDQ